MARHPPRSKTNRAFFMNQEHRERTEKKERIIREKRENPYFLY